MCHALTDEINKHRLTFDVCNLFDREGTPSTAIDSLSGACPPSVAICNSHHSCPELLMMWRTGIPYCTQYSEK